MSIHFEAIKLAVIKAGYHFFKQGDYNLNLVGIRNQDQQSDAFNDWLCVLFYLDTKPILFKFPFTSDPGKYYRVNPSHPQGVAIVKPGQYPGLWCTGLHKGQYQALVQKAPITVYRDNNKDDFLDLDVPTDSGHYGINCHRSVAHGVSKKVGRWSAGCQVLANADDFRLLMALCAKASSIWGNSFSYTLLEEGQHGIL